jgi:hypothetical protein
MTTNWTIQQLERKANDGFVVNVHWRYSMTETEETGKTYYADIYSVASYTENPEAEGYIPYEELTKEIVVGWVKDSLGEERLEEIEKSLTEQIQSQKNPPILAGIPWEVSSTLTPEVPTEVEDGEIVEENSEEELEG